MRFVRALFVPVLIAVSAGLAMGGELLDTDPQVKIGGTGLVFQGHGAPVSIDVPDFSVFSSTGNSPGTSPCVRSEKGKGNQSSPDCLFENEIAGYPGYAEGDFISVLTFEVPRKGNAKVKCGFEMDSPFSDCSVELMPGEAMVTFFDGSIPFQNEFTLDFEGFGAKSIFVAHATTAVPEPGTLALLVLGIAALVAATRGHAGTRLGG